MAIILKTDCGWCSHLYEDLPFQLTDSRHTSHIIWGKSSATSYQIKVTDLNQHNTFTQQYVHRTLDSSLVFTSSDKRISRVWVTSPRSAGSRGSLHESICSRGVRNSCESIYLLPGLCSLCTGPSQQPTVSPADSSSLFLLNTEHSVITIIKEKPIFWYSNIVLNVCVWGSF